MKRERAYKTRSPSHRPTRVEEPEPQKAKSRQRLKAELDELLADIDEALEGVETTLAQNYRQKGGE